VDVTALRVVGFEALLRWDHPVHGPIGPAEFIPIAEESGVIDKVGQWVLEHACEETEEWGRAVAIATPDLWINISGRQLDDPEFVAGVAATLERAGVDPARLTFEVTESVLAREDSSRTLRELRGLGIGIALDDFGTGFSSLSYLGNLPLDVIKVPSEFVTTIGQDGRWAALTEAVVRLAASLGMQVVAEGVEREDQLAALRRYGCDFAQGHLFSAPLPPQNALGLLTERGGFVDLAAPGVSRRRDQSLARVDDE
jgi:EAL domain-containing protein (putative c-di-GMP-specific phosphodiesterase class I)